MSGIAVRPYAHGDADDVERIVLAAYGRPINPSVLARMAIENTVAFVAESDGAVAGFVNVADYGTMAYLGSMAVDPRQQRGGIGTALMSALVAHPRITNIPALLLDATDAGGPLYERFGFVDVDRTLVFETSPSDPMVGEIPSAEAIALAIEIDRRLLGCDRSHVIASLARQENTMLRVRVDGYVMTRGCVVGPWVAASPSIASELFAEVRNANGGITRAFIPACNVAAARIASEHNFWVRRTLRHMARGLGWMPRTLVYGQASLGHG